MKQPWLPSVIAALGVTTICCLWIVGPLVSPSHDAVYHWSGPASTIFIPALVDFLAAWLVFSILLLAARGTRRAAAVLRIGVLLILPLAAVENLFLFMEWHLPQWCSISLLSICAAAFVAFNFGYRYISQARLQLLTERAAKLLCVVAIGGALLLVQAAWFGLQASRFAVSSMLHAEPTSAGGAKAGHPRVVWIVLDELGYEQVYEHRFSGLQLPAFDQLARQSTVLSDVGPAGVMTDVVMPSLIAGVPVDRIQPSATGASLMMHNPALGQWQRFDPHNTVFGDAMRAGYTPALAGWYNPYCRILSGVLDQCYWTFSELSANRMLSQASIISNIFNPLLLSSSVLNHLPSAMTHGYRTQDLTARLHIADYQKISAAGDRYLQDPSIGFLLIHTAVPHPGGIYNRATQQLVTRGASYIDNLALADLYLAHVRALLESSGQWDSSAVVVMGDHSWRTKQLWANAWDWTREDQAASNGGRFDDRPAYIIKLPGQRQSVRSGVPFKAVNTRALLDGIMRGEIVSPSQLLSFVESTQRRP